MSTALWPTSFPTSTALPATGLDTSTALWPTSLPTSTALPPTFLVVSIVFEATPFRKRPPPSPPPLPPTSAAPQFEQLLAPSGDSLPQFEQNIWLTASEEGPILLVDWGLPSGPEN